MSYVPEAASVAPPAKWTRFYWPAALTLAVLGFVTADKFAPGIRGVVLAAGAALIIVPEITVLLLHRPQDTFSDWTWSVIDVTRHQGFRDWTAAHILALLAYVVIAVRVLSFMWVHSGYWLAAAATAVTLWLLRHLFWGVWR